MAMHTLKCHAEYFDAVVSGLKTFELRKNDRDFRVDDDITLVRTDENGRPTEPRQEVVKSVHYLLEGGKFGLLHGYVIMGFSRASSLDSFDDDEIEAEYEKRFGADLGEVERIYRLLAEGEVNEAMDEMSRTFDLPPPYQAKGIAAKIARGRQKEELVQ